MDRLSELPNDILHDIFVHLPWKQTAATKVLSKRWISAVESFPILDLDTVFSYPLSKDANDKLLNITDTSIERFMAQNLPMKRFKISIGLNSEPDSVALMDRWLGLAVFRSVEELDLRFGGLFDHYTLPRVVFLAMSLQSLSLFNCDLVLPSSVNLVSLKKLTLRSVRLDDSMLRTLLAGCPCIEDFLLKRSRGLKNFEISGLNCLKSVDIEWWRIENIRIDAPNLERLHNHYAKRDPLPYHVYIMCSRLIDVSFVQVPVTELILYELIYNNPRIETLELCHCQNLKRLKILSSCLKKLTVKSCDNLEEVHIDAPSLQELTYAGHFLASFLHNSTICTGKLIIYPAFSMVQWREFMSNPVEFNTLKLQLTVPVLTEERSLPGESQRAATASWKVEHLELCVYSAFGAKDWNAIPSDLVCASIKPKTFVVKNTW